MLETGLKGSREIIVTEEKTAAAMGSGQLQVFATPAMIALIEETAWTSVAPYLDEGCGTVGTKIEVEHVAPTLVGMKVRCETVLALTDRRKLVFEASVYDEAGRIGFGRHERFIIDNRKFLEKAGSRI